MAMIHRKLAKTYGQSNLNDATVCRWVQAFQEGKMELAEEHQSRWVHDNVMKENTEAVLLEDSHFTFDELTYHLLDWRANGISLELRSRNISTVDGQLLVMHGQRYP